jgi:hypothetical protein
VNHRREAVGFYIGIGVPHSYRIRACRNYDVFAQRKIYPVMSFWY